MVDTTVKVQAEESKRILIKSYSMFLDSSKEHFEMLCSFFEFFMIRFGYDSLNTTGYCCWDRSWLPSAYVAPETELWISPFIWGDCNELQYMVMMQGKLREVSWPVVQFTLSLTSIHTFLKFKTCVS